MTVQNRTFPTAAAVVALILGTAGQLFATATTPKPIPEPSLLVMLAAGVGGAVLYARSRRNRK
jgi:hypothetical protein